MKNRKLYAAMKLAKEQLDILRNEYVRLGSECHRNNDFAGRDYWNERFFQLGLEIEKLDMDLRKLKEESES